MTDVAEIAKGLSEAQRKELLDGYKLPQDDSLVGYTVSRNRRIAGKLVSKKLLIRKNKEWSMFEPDYEREPWYALTPLGLAVRNHIKGQDNAG